MKTKQILSTFFLLLCALLFLAPTLILILNAFSFNKDVKPFYYFIEVFTKDRTIQSFKSGFLISSLASTISISLSLLTASAFSHRKDTVSNYVSSIILLFGGMPFSTLVIPLYFALFTLHLIDSIQILILFLAAINLPSNIWILEKTLSSIPKEYEETARLEGANYKHILFQILLPTLISSFSAAFITSFINCWGNFIVPFILLSSSKKMPVALSFFQLFSSSDNTMTNYISAYAISYYIPVIILYLVLRVGVTRLFIVQRLKN